MGLILQWKVRQRPGLGQTYLPPRQKLPLILSRMLAAGAVDFARVALDAWGNQEMEPEELLELCNAYASVADLKTLA